MFAKIKHWYYKNCLQRELQKMDDYRNDPDYYLCADGSKECVEIQKCENRISFYRSKLWALPYFKGDWRLF